MILTIGYMELLITSGFLPSYIQLQESFGPQIQQFLFGCALQETEVLLIDFFRGEHSYHYLDYHIVYI